jgi:hypothetical protein
MNHLITVKSRSSLLACFAAATIASAPTPFAASGSPAQPAQRLLRVHPENPRYFVDGGRPLVLIGRYHADFICSTSEHFTKSLPGYINYLKEELNVNFTQVWAIMIFSGRQEAEYGVNTGGPMFMPFLRTGPGINYYGEPKYDLTRFDPAYFAKFHEFLRADKSFPEWQALGQDKDSMIADPSFVDPASGDFRLGPNSPVQQIGFKPWEFLSKSVSRRAALPKPADLPAQMSLPDPLVMLDGRKVTSREMWFEQRRPELIRLFQHYMYGRLPPRPETLSIKVERVDAAAFGGKATLREVTLKFGPPEAPAIHLMTVAPNHRTKPAPVVLAINYFGNHTLVRDKNVRLADNWMPERGAGVVANRATEASRGSWVDIWRIEDVIDRGYALATFYNGDVDPDTPDQRGLQKYFRHDDPADDCGSIGAWAWGLQRAVDYLVTAQEVDPRRIIVTGHSRMGKAALLAAAFDERIALAMPHQAGCGGSAPSRAKIALDRPYDTLDTPKTKPPETVADINDKFPHWFNARFKEFNKQPEKLPFDQNCLVALCAPRPVLFTNGRADTWINPAGQFEVLREAAPVYRLLNAGDFNAEALPADGQLMGGALGYYLRPEGHSLLKEDWKVFLDFADKQLSPP